MFDSDYIRKDFENESWKLIKNNARFVDSDTENFLMQLILSLTMNLAEIPQFETVLLCANSTTRLLTYFSSVSALIMWLKFGMMC